MVYLSEVVLNPRRHAVMRALGDSYALHRLVSMTFRGGDREGLGRVLYRADSVPEGVRLLIQSAQVPELSRLGPMLIRQRGPKAVALRSPAGEPVFKRGTVLRFRLHANPTFRAGRDHTQEVAGKRLAIMDRSGQLEWLRRKGTHGGFELIPVPQGSDWCDPFEGEPEARAEVRITELDFFNGYKRGGDATHRITQLGVRFDGVLRVIESESFVHTLETGVGAGKGFGFGLLSVARV